MINLYDTVGHRQRKVTMVCHSMGCTLTRNFLAYAMEMHALHPEKPSALDMVDSVTSMQGVQAGAILAKIGIGVGGSYESYPPGLSLGLQSKYKNAIKQNPDLQFRSRSTSCSRTPPAIDLLQLDAAAIRDDQWSDSATHTRSGLL